MFHGHRRQNQQRRLELIWAQRGFRYFSVAMFVSLFGSGLNFTAVSWYILSATHSTIAVSMQVIVVTLPGLFVPFLGGVLIDRYDRRYLGIALDIARGVAVLTIAYLAWKGHLDIWHLYVMTLITGTGSAMYWACVNALVQEVMPPNQFTGANAAVLIGVQSGMLMAGAFVGFIYDTIGISGILAIDGATYLSRRFAVPDAPRLRLSAPRNAKAPALREYSEATEATALALESGGNPEVAEAGLSLSVFADLKEGFAYLKKAAASSRARHHPRHDDGRSRQRQRNPRRARQRRASCGRARPGISRRWLGYRRHHRRLARQPTQRQDANVILRRLHRRPVRRTHRRPIRRLRGRRRHHSSIFGFCRAVSGVVAQSTLMMIVPRHFMGRTQSSIAIVTTVLQLLMSVSLGWVAQRISLFAGFSLLGLMYAGAGAFATRARQLLTENS